MYQPDALDRQLISCLQRNGRMPFVELALAAGVSEATARRRVERLLDEGIVQVVACVEPHRLGLQAEAVVYLQTDLDKLTQIGRRLAAMPEAREVLYTSGAHDLVLRVVLPSGDDLLPFLTQRVAPIPGIRATQTSHVLRVEKQLSEWQLGPLSGGASAAGPGRQILLVDDDADFVAAARMVLEAAGYGVVVAGSGREALERLGDARPALVLLDLMMETPLAGLEVARAVRADRRLRGVPVLAISAIHSSEWAGALPPAEELPLDDFVDKPIEPGRLLDKVRRFIG